MVADSKFACSLDKSSGGGTFRVDDDRDDRLESLSDDTKYDGTGVSQIIGLFRGLLDAGTGDTPGLELGEGDDDEGQPQ
jgi:hypothetical protein